MNVGTVTGSKLVCRVIRCKDYYLTVPVDMFRSGWQIDGRLYIILKNKGFTSLNRIENSWISLMYEMWFKPKEVS